MTKQIKHYWQLVAARVDEMSLRQRGMLFATLSLALVAVVHAVLLEPVLTRQKSLIERAKRDQSQLAAVRGQIQSIIAQQQRDPEQAALRVLEERVAATERALTAKRQRFAAATRLPGLLKDLLGSDRGVSVESLRVLPGAQVEGSAMYRHGVELTLTGGYLDLLRYLIELEKLPLRLLWGSAELTAENYPQVRLALQVHTLSPDRSLGL